MGSDKPAFRREGCRHLCELEARALAGLGENGPLTNSSVTVSWKGPGDTHRLVSYIPLLVPGNSHQSGLGYPSVSQCSKDDFPHKPE